MSPPNAGGAPNALCLPLKLLPGLLFGIQPARVRAELSDTIPWSQRDCYEAPWQAFMADALPPAPATGAAGAAPAV